MGFRNCFRVSGSLWKLRVPQGIRCTFRYIEIRFSSGTIATMTRTISSLSVFVLLVTFVLTVPGSRTPSPVDVAGTVSASDDSTIFPIYSDSVTDPWNRMFYCLFTRTFKVHFSDQFSNSDAGPFADVGDFMNLRVGAREIERTESGDRPIDPLYYPPPFSPDGTRQLLTGQRYSMLTAALGDALGEPRPRAPLARALLQSDLWSAYDLIYWDLFPQDRGTILDSHKQTLSHLIAQLIQKLALSPEEIDSLPDNYVAARSRDSLPDLFSPASDWIELQYLPERLHDSQAGFRRVSRVFVKPSHPPADKQKFLNSLRSESGEASADVAGAVILIQPILINTLGHLAPSHLTTDVEFRLFQWSNSGAFQKTDVHTYEFSRRLLLDQPTTGGFEVENENSPVYLSNGGSYGFAEEIAFGANGSDKPALPIVVRLRTRCAHCHSENLTLLMSFAFAHPPNTLLPPVKQLDQTAHQAADYDMERKSESPEWHAIHAFLTSSERVRARTEGLNE